MTKILTGPLAQDARSSPAEVTAPDADTAALLAKIKNTTERLFAAIEGDAVKGKPLPAEGELLSGEEFNPKPSAKCFNPEELKRLSRLRARRRRNAIDEFFEWPTWDMLLELAAARDEGVHLSVSSVCIASGAPQSTALRKLAALEDAKFVERYYHGHDGRRVHLRLTDQGAEMVASALRDELAFYRSLMPPS